MSQTSPSIIDVTTATFEQDVVQRSMDTLIVIDFWATWCQPCRQLAPILEKLAQEYAGRFVLAKINVDENPDLAGAFGVQSIPFVVAIKDARPVNHFMGVLPEAQLREWIGALLPSPADELVKKGQELELAQPAEAEAAYRQAAELAPDSDAIRIHLARVLLAQNREDEVRRILQKLEERGFLEPEAERIKSELELRASAEEAGSLQDARRALEASPNDLSLKLKLAEALAGAGKYADALDQCLQIVQSDRSGVGVDAKETMLRIFDTLGGGSELVSEYRRKLATALY